MPTSVQTLSSLPLFADLETEELEKFLSLVRHQKVAEAEVITRRKAPASTFFINLSGNFMIAFDEGRAITLHQKGDIMGWSVVFTPFRYKGTTVALTDGEVLSIPGKDFLHLISDNTSMGEKIMKKINAIASERMAFINEPE